MKGKNIRYLVGCFDSVMYCHKYKKWLLMDDPKYGEENHKGYSSHRNCKTFKSAIKQCRKLDNLVEKGKGIFIMRFIYPKGKRHIIDFNYQRKEK